MPDVEYGDGAVSCLQQATQATGQRVVGAPSMTNTVNSHGDTVLALFCCCYYAFVFVMNDAFCFFVNTRGLFAASGYIELSLGASTPSLRKYVSRGIYESCTKVLNQLEALGKDTFLQPFVSSVSVLELTQRNIYLCIGMNRLNAAFFRCAVSIDNILTPSIPGLRASSCGCPLYTTTRCQHR